MAKNRSKILLIVGFALIVAALLFIAFNSSMYSTVVTEPDDDTEAEIELDQRINYFELIYSREKDPALNRKGEERLKIEQFPEPEPEPPPQPAAPPSAPSGSASAGQKEQQMVSLINQARSSAGLPSLQVNGQLTSAARAKSKDMVDNNYFNHHSPTYGSFTNLLRQYGVSYSAAAENIAMNSDGNVNSAHNMLMNSPGHRANILGSNFRSVGVGIHVRSDGTHYYTQLFVGR
jgi:uncharacterized YkwD family protein